ncbi:ATP-binding cassette domain-containing protein, partial [Pseudomonas aeruginosa]|uniref:ATP-binding cassette domain-containing protein n=1 Tax=Pseudomonas aeruginosa TaxID=287 RepID=UPI0039682A0C
MTHRLHADAVTLRRDARTVSRNLSLAIPEGSFSVIVGPNACGKSTLLAALSRLLAPAEGRVLPGKAAIWQRGLPPPRRKAR